MEWDFFAIAQFPDQCRLLPLSNKCQEKKNLKYTVSNSLYSYIYLFSTFELGGFEVLCFFVFTCFAFTELSDRFMIILAVMEHGVLVLYLLRRTMNVSSGLHLTQNFLVSGRAPT